MPAQAEVTRIDASVGWNDLVRPGRWHPATATLEANRRHDAVLEWYVPQHGRQAMVLRQPATLNPGKQTFLATLPVGPDPWAIHLRIADAETDQTLAHWPTTPRSPVDLAALLGDDGTPLVALAGESFDGIDATRVPLTLLPRTAVAYEALDVLVLAGLDLASLEPEVDAAIAAWVRGGGTLWIWLDGSPVPSRGAVLSLLPALPTQRVADDNGAGRWLLDGIDPLAGVTRATADDGEVVFFHRRPIASDLPTIQIRPDDADVVVAPAPRTGSLATRLLPIALLLGPIEWIVLRLAPTRVRRRGWWTLVGWLLLPVVAIGWLTSGPAEVEEPSEAWWTVAAEPGTTGPIRDHVVVLGPDGLVLPD